MARFHADLIQCKEKLLIICSLELGKTTASQMEWSKMCIFQLLGLI